MVLNLILIASSISISIIGLLYIYLNRENLGSTINVLLNGLIYIFLGIFFFTFFFLSIESSYFTSDVALSLWHISLFFWTVSLSLLSIIHKFVINYEKKPILSTLFYALMIGIIMGLSFNPNAFSLTLNFNIYSIFIQNTILLFLLLSYNLIIIGTMCYNSIKNYSKMRNNLSKKMLFALTLQFSLIILIYSLNVISPNIITKYIYAFFYLICACFISYYLITKPFLFIELTNKIYDFIIFHRSGILLYSYNFETGESTDESLLKGSILIGINHILSNFINKKDQLGLIRMQNRDIILEYDNNHGYALLLTTNHKNKYIDKAVSNFMLRFTSLNKEKFKNLNGLIDVSEFRNAEDLLKEYFEPFIYVN